MTAELPSSSPPPQLPQLPPLPQLPQLPAASINHHSSGIMNTASRIRPGEIPPRRTGGHADAECPGEDQGGAEATRFLGE